VFALATFSDARQKLALALWPVLDGWMSIVRAFTAALANSGGVDCGGNANATVGQRASKAEELGAARTHQTSSMIAHHTSVA
jgi:hypothetical protein